jgi:hypothetical protein
MIEVQITNCPDPDFQGTWKFYKNQIYLGFPEGDISPEGELPSFGFMIEVLPDFLQAHPNPNVEFWLLNGKRASKPRKIKIGDTLQVGNIIFKVTEAKFQEFQTKKQILDKNLKALIAEDAPILGLIQLLNAKTK